MPDININGVVVNFPFEPYDVQKKYMSKVIECLQNETHAVLESPTGTGKTLSLLCATLGWLQEKKMQVKKTVKAASQMSGASDGDINLSEQYQEMSKNWSVPKIIYATRTHSQLTQAMQELKRCSYSYMKAVVLGSRDQLCVHPEVSKELGNALKTHMCKIYVTNRSCLYYNRLETKKDSPDMKTQSVMDIEDLVLIGRKLKICPYYGSREVVPEADIVFMPYNYLLDPKTWKANKVELNNTIIILDEAHNVEKVCEEAASVNIKLSDFAVAIDDITHVIKYFTDNNLSSGDDETRDFSLDDLVLFKEILLELEKVIDGLEVKNKFEGSTYPGDYIFELLQQANINFDNYTMILTLLDKVNTFLVTTQQKNSAFSKGSGLQIIGDFLTIVFAGKTTENKEKSFLSFKLHVEVEEIQSKGAQKSGGWLNSKATGVKIDKIINYWCFNAGYGMEQLLNKKVRNIILTSGTLAPLKPFIAELDLPVTVTLENPHIVGSSQVCVKIVSHGPDKERLISNYENRDNPKYINSLGMTISNFCTVIPDGLLIFFPSYFLMNKCVDSWKLSGVWEQINKRKSIFVEPKGKDSFTSTMTDFYAAIEDTKSNGACFLAVCRGKVSEGLDFADRNGRAVIITGLPFPPFKDPRIILKRQYLDKKRTKENEILSGQSWYAIEGSRAVNQAIGRVIRHKDDYGAIILCDIRFNQKNQQNQLSSWVQGHLKNSNHNQSFGLVLRDLRCFFENARKTTSRPNVRECYGTSSSETKVKDENNSHLVYKLKEIPRSSPLSEGFKVTSSWNITDYSNTPDNTSKIDPLDFMSRLNENSLIIDFNKSESSCTNVAKMSTDNKCMLDDCTKKPAENTLKRKRLKLIATEIIPQPKIPSNSRDEENQSISQISRKEFLELIKSSVSKSSYTRFIEALMQYRNDETVDRFFKILLEIFGVSKSLHYILKEMRRYIKESHKSNFDKLLENYLKSSE